MGAVYPWKHIRCVGLESEWSMSCSIMFTFEWTTMTSSHLQWGPSQTASCWMSDPSLIMYVFMNFDPSALSHAAISNCMLWRREATRTRISCSAGDTKAALLPGMEQYLVALAAVIINRFRENANKIQCRGCWYVSCSWVVVLSLCSASLILQGLGTPPPPPPPPPK